MELITEPYGAQEAGWPALGRHILAQYDDEGIVVYQAYRPEIGHFAAEHGYFGGAFSLSRMSWIKPNFLWMMFRCGWATKPDQETVLAVTLKRAAFDAILRDAVPSSFTPTLYGSEAEWRLALAASSVRVQWDPDHDPAGVKLARRALQLGLRDEALRRYAREWILSIEDITAFVREQAEHVHGNDYARLRTPREREYVPGVALAARLRIGEARP